MPRPAYRDIVTGLGISAAGLFIGWYAASRYNIGTLATMGPGMFPTVLGVMMVILGALIAVPALMRAEPAPEFEFRSTLATLASIAAFATLITTAGLVPAVFALTILSAFADGRLRLLGSIALGAALSLFAYLIFIAGLGLTVPAFRWPL